jgi:monoamine oxidase
MVTSQLRNYYPDMPEPKAWHITRWEEDIFSQGAYSYHDCNITDKDIHNVYKNIDNVIFFAGEHTDPLYYGSLHAAYNSGVRVLKELSLD